MTLEVIAGVNWVAVIVAAILYFALGAVWYMPSLPTGRAWTNASGMRMPEGASPNPIFYVAPFVAYLVAAAATAILARATATDTFGEAIVLGLVVAVGYSITSWFIAAAFDPQRAQKPRPWTWFGLNSAYHLIGLLIVAVVVSLWR